MSYDIYLNHPITEEVLEFDEPHHMRGGTYSIGGTIEAHLNVTFNYSVHYYKIFGDDGIFILDGMTGADAIPVLQKAIDALGDDIDRDYWKSTEGNAKAALLKLMALAKMRPDGVFSIED